MHSWLVRSLPYIPLISWILLIHTSSVSFCIRFHFMQREVKLNIVLLVQQTLPLETSSEGISTKSQLVPIFHVRNNKINFVLNIDDNISYLFFSSFSFTICKILSYVCIWQNSFCLYFSVLCLSMRLYIWETWRTPIWHLF